MKVACTSMIHAAAPHFLWPFAVRYAAHQLNLWPRVSLPKTSPTLCWTREVGDASVFRVWGSRAFDRDTSADKLSARAIPCGPAPSGVSQVNPLPRNASVEVAVGSGAAPGAASGGVASGGAKSGGAGSEGAGSGGAEPGGEEPRGDELEGVEPGGAESEGAESGGAEPRGATSSGGAGDTRAGGAGVTAGAGGTGGTTATGPGGTRTKGTGATGTGGVGGARARDPTEPGAAGARGSCAGGAAALVDPRAGGAGDTSQPSLQPASPLPAPSPYTEESGVLTQRREPASRLISHVRTAPRVPRSRPPRVPDMHTMALRPSSVPLRVPLPAPPGSSLPELWLLHSCFFTARAASPTVSRLLATTITNPSFVAAAASALVAELLDFAAACRLDHVTTQVVESASASPPSVGDIPTPRSYAEAITGPYSFQWQAPMDAEMASWKATSTYFVLQRFNFQFSSPQPTPLSTGHSLSAPPLDESVEPSGLYAELVGCLITSSMGLVLGGRGPVVLIGHADASWADDSATQRSSQGYTFSLGSGSVSWRSTRSSLVLSSSCEAEIYAGALAAQELRWLTYLLTDLGEQPRSPPVLYVDNKAMIAMC
ncbi:unnamed protein product [Closterium sp. NIES-54]